MLMGLSNSVLSLLLPQKCRNCNNIIDDQNGLVACTDCWEAVTIYRGLETSCIKCGAFLSTAEPLYESHCNECDGHHYDLARSVALYNGAVSSAILHLKQVPKIPPRLSDELCREFDRSFRTSTDLIIPVPLSKKRLHERGFNQASVIAKILSKRFEIEMDEISLGRKFDTPIHRAGMDRRARELTVEHAFEVRRPQLVRGKSILLIDDVFTSGYTVSGCARALKKKGAARVDVLTIARAVPIRLQNA
jgi:ComF family protein